MRVTQPRPSPPPLALLFSCATSRSCPFAHPCVLSLFSCFSLSFWAACAAVQVLGQGGVLVRGACAQPRPCSIFPSLSLFLASPPCCLAPAWPSQPPRGPQPCPLSTLGPCAALRPPCGLALRLCAGRRRRCRRPLGGHRMRF